ncbi:uncharacterized protein MONOS_4967 [Monocercomonoides exilis]|uniref:uncharacterized protein n=1 Tax=Monocercomonoides exilis TaxID=2049356 RepID=UPI00355A6F19|nr:hypothetical protein MONOS_4967 [Monocercomonoides exilis]|eukprot:MONOS_4967.1-p1 / transcript=MONOS_4967.1 / gene=MONOS_4967 / organism=Monocercomonoides_exilis_PA203 / gene_product=unspecified product / transcript_product=unspecified product / location=Mono_scaffold00139:56421-56828(+) / protein_length=105 / sequence_SO=supercontig / SO=protein_coding / is_pseudo=false
MLYIIYCCTVAILLGEIAFCFMIQKRLFYKPIIRCSATSLVAGSNSIYLIQDPNLLEDCEFSDEGEVIVGNKPADITLIGAPSELPDISQPLHDISSNTSLIYV